MSWWAKLRKKTEITKAIASPDGRIECHFALKNNQLFYAVTKDGKSIIKPSRLDLLIAGAPTSYDHLILVRTVVRRHTETFEMPIGEDRYIKNNYQEAAFYLAESDKNNRIFTLRFRVFNEGVAFRYEIPPQPAYQQLIIKNE